ncbi:MAG: tetratricopeptide repeat protein [Cyclobacteriaceae bacterium]
MEYKIQTFRPIKFRLFAITLLILLKPFCDIKAQEIDDLDPLSKRFLSHIESQRNPADIIEFIEEHQQNIPTLIINLKEAINQADSFNYKLTNTAKFIYRTSPQPAKYLAQLSYDMAVERRDTANILYATSILGTVVGEIGDFQEALIYFFRNLKMSDPTNRYEEYLSALNEIGRLYLYMNDFENSKKYFEEEIAVATEHDEEHGINAGYLNLGCVYYEMGDFDTALELINKSYQYGIQVQDTSFQYNSLGNLAGLYFEKKDTEKAIDLQKKGLAFEIALDDKVAMIDSYANLALFHGTLTDRHQAIEYYEKSLSIGLELNVVDKIISTYDVGIEIYDSWGDYQKALEISLLRYDLYDEALNLKRNNQVAEMREKYETQKKEVDIINLRKDNTLAELTIEKEKDKNLILIIVSLFVALVLIFVIFIYLQASKRKKETEQRNELITDINKKLSRSQDALIVANKTRDKFFALIAHDLRGPISSFQGIGRMIAYTLKKGRSENTLELIKSVDESANRINSLLDNLLKWALSQTGTLPFRPQPLDLNMALQDTLEMYEHSFSAKNITLESDMPNELWVYADHNSVSTVMRNLLGNAQKFTPDGGHVQLEGKIVNQYAEVTVTDNGVGIPPEKLAHIFNLDHQKSTMGTHGEKGTGLGLMLCEEFIAKNGGEITIQSQVGQGTSITFSLPLANNQAAKVPVLKERETA